MSVFFSRSWDMNRSAEQTNRTRTASRFTRFVCSALRFISHEPRKKDTHSLNVLAMLKKKPSCKTVTMGHLLSLLRSNDLSEMADSLLGILPSIGFNPAKTATLYDALWQNVSSACSEKPGCTFPHPLV